MSADGMVGSGRLAADALLIGVAAWLCYGVVLAQSSLYGDGHWLLTTVDRGVVSHPHHIAYQRLLFEAHRLLQPLGFGLYRVALLTSASGAAAGVACSYVGLRLLALPRGTALLATACVAATPAVMFFATVVEYHGAFFGPAGLAFAAAAALARRPRVVGAVLLGAATWAAAAMHATGHALPLVLGLLFLAVTGAGRRRALVLVSVAVGVHGVLAGLTFTLLRMAAGVESSSGAGFLGGYAEVLHYSAAGGLRTLWFDFVLPLLPLSLVWVFGFRRAATRSLAWAAAAAIGPYLLFTFLLTNGSSERGAYMLPLVWPLVLIAARLLRPRWLAAVIAVAAAWGTIGILAADRPAAARAFAAGLRQVAPLDRVVLLTAPDDTEALFVWLPRTTHVNLMDVIGLRPDEFAAALAQIPTHVRGYLARGKRVFLTAAAEAALRSAVTRQVQPAAPRLLDVLLASFAGEPVVADGFRALELRER